MPLGLRKVSFDKKDTEGNAVQLNVCFELNNGNVSEAIDYLKVKYGNNLRLVPIGGLSAGAGIFQHKKKEEDAQTIGLIISPPTALSEKQNVFFTISETPPTQFLRTQEMHIDQSKKIAYAGAGVVLDQLNASVKEALGDNFTVLGTDLTSSGYASAGATFMTGGMGPSRSNFGLQVLAINFYNGGLCQEISDKSELKKLVETYGWTGCVESIAIQITEVPPCKFGFALPTNNQPADIAKTIEYFAKHTNQNNLSKQDILIDGIEIISGESLQLIAKHFPNLSGLQTLISNCKIANKNSVIFISGRAQKNPFENIDDPLRIFVDNKTSGLSLEQATPFENLQAMKMIREGAPELARRQLADALFSYKDHTDINVVLDRKNIKQGAEAIMECYHSYKIRIQKLIEDTENLKGNVQVYGHLNPQGLDPHYRITLVSEDKKVVEDATLKAKNFYAMLVQEINLACQKTGATLTGGEKGIISNLKIIDALTQNNQLVPAGLSDLVSKQKSKIEAANKMFNWRAKFAFKNR